MWYLVVRNKWNKWELVAKAPFDTIEEARRWGQSMMPSREWSPVHKKMAGLYPCEYIRRLQ